MRGDPVMTLPRNENTPPWIACYIWVGTRKIPVANPNVPWPGRPGKRRLNHEQG